MLFISRPCQSRMVPYTSHSRRLIYGTPLGYASHHQYLNHQLFPCGPTLQGFAELACCSFANLASSFSVSSATPPDNWMHMSSKSRSLRPVWIGPGASSNQTWIMPEEENILVKA